MDRNEAAAALHGIDTAKASLADVNLCPPWRHAVFGVIMTMLVVAPSLGLPLQGVLTVLAFVLIALVAWDDRRRMGMFVNGWRRGATLPVALALAGGTVTLMVAEIHAREAALTLATKLGLAALEFVLATVGSVIWQRTYVRELRRRSA